MIFLKKQVFRKIRYTLEVLKKNQFFPIFWKKNRKPYLFKIIINLGSNYKLMLIFTLEL